jgi:hypothetical protein
MSSSRSCFFLRDGNIVGCRGRKQWPHSAQRQRQSRSCRHRHQHQRRSRSPLRIEHESPDGWRHGSSPGRPITAFTVGGRSFTARNGSSLSTTMTGLVLISIARLCGGRSRKSPPVGQWGSTGANANEAPCRLEREIAQTRSAARGRLLALRLSGWRLGAPRRQGGR